MADFFVAAKFRDAAIEAAAKSCRISFYHSFLGIGIEQILQKRISQDWIEMKAWSLLIFCFLYIDAILLNGHGCF